MSETHELLLRVWHRELSADDAYEEIVDKYDKAADKVISLAARVAELEQQLSSYAGAVEVEGRIVVDENEVSIINDVHCWPVGHGLDIGQRVRVLVLKGAA